MESLWRRIVALGRGRPEWVPGGLGLLLLLFMLSTAVMGYLLVARSGGNDPRTFDPGELSLSTDQTAETPLPLIFPLNTAQERVGMVRAAGNQATPPLGLPASLPEIPPAPLPPKAEMAANALLAAPPAPAPMPTLELPHADDLTFSEPEAEDFVYPVDFLKTAPLRDRIQFRNLIVSLLKFGWEPSGLAKARDCYAQAMKLCDDDPRVPYALGLVLWKQQFPDEATQQLHLAATKGKFPYLPAIQAEAWTHILSQKPGSGQQQMLRLAEVLRETQGTDYPTPGQRETAALFLGRGIGFLKGPGKNQATPDFPDVVQAIEAVLPDELKSVLVQGQSQVAHRFQELKGLADLPADQVLNGFRESQQALEDSQRQTGKQYRDARAELPGFSSGHRQKMNGVAQQLNQLAGHAQLLAAQEQSYRQLAAELSQPRTITETRVVRVPVERAIFDKKGNVEKTVTTYENQTQTFTRPENGNERTARLAQVQQALNTALRLRGEFQNLSDTASQVKANGVKLNDEHLEKMRARQLEMSQLAKKQAELKAGIKRIAGDQETFLDLRKRTYSIDGYVPWDLETERDGLLLSYKSK